ncbi:unnamed protein product [Adineta ricciae]|uniref:CxC5 like cysteine cluster associated with KDZ domain-containing protein n=1 Tax=Adineta ricciae TaxID=249248 RepID=A0A815S7M3_ADIRI|nr:unnamed protein product [Adineta ricciae]CAF1487192.1 unnamed protein product [Adineta ricciae]
MNFALRNPFELFQPLPNIEISTTLRRLDIRIDKNVPNRVQHITAILNSLYQSTYTVTQIDVRLANWNIILPMIKDEIAGKLDHEIDTAVKNYCKQNSQNHVVSLLHSYIPTITNCLNIACNRTSLNSPCPYQDVSIFRWGKESEKGTLFYKLCPSCKAKYHYNCIVLTNGTKFLHIEENAEVVVLFSNVGYEKNILHQLDADILFKHSGFSNFVNAYNFMCQKNGCRDTRLMDRFHIEKTWFIWSLGHFFREVNIYIRVPTGTDFQSALLQIQPDLKKLFAQKWARKNHETYCGPNCCATVVLDGHQKATRRVCRVKNLTVPCEDDSLPSVKVGCSATPAFKSKVCEAHKSDNNNDDEHPVSHEHHKRKRHNLRANKNCRPLVFSLRCKTLKSLQYKRILHRTSGIIAAAYNCGFICSISELFGSESIKQVYNFLVYMMKNCEHVPDVLIYDDACHLKRFVQNKNNFIQETPANQRISQLQIFCDKLHYRNHTDPWCRKHTNPRKHPIANSTNTEVCEQIFSWLAQYKNIVRGFDESTFLTYICLICDLYNTNKLANIRKKHEIKILPMRLD